MIAWRRSIVIAAFVAAIVAVVVLNARAAGSVAGASATIRLTEVSHASGIDFVHQAPALDPKIANVAPHVGALGACVSVADVNNDGWPDLYITGYFRSDIDFWHLTTTRIMQHSWEFATNGGKNLLFKNLGLGRFRDVTDSLGVGSTRWTLAVTAADFNDDGWPDLYLANDYGPEELDLNHEGKHFELARAGLQDDSKSGMAVALGDVYNRGEHDVFVTNISEKGFLFQGNNLRLNFLKELGRFDEVATGPVADAGWAWGAQFGDLNNDGLLDLVVANGFISGDSAHDYWYAMS